MHTFLVVRGSRLEVHESRSAKVELSAYFRGYVKFIAYISGGAVGSPAEV